ncbi:MAG: hypothetical protein AAFQ82_07060 [Myxococcota bacterium]
MKRPLQCTNIDRFQHYKSRKPPWIKLYRDILDDAQFHAMSAEARALLPMLWLVASEHNEGLVEGDSAELAWRLRRDSKVLAPALDEILRAGFFRDLGNVAPCKQDASATLAGCKQDAIPETETETETEERQRQNTVALASRSLAVVGSDPPIEEPPVRSKEILAVFDHYRTHHPRAHKKPTSKQAEWKKIKARLDEGYTVDDLKLAIDGCHVSPFHCGENERGQLYQKLELIVRDGSRVNQFIEAYENRDAPVFSEKTKRGLRAGEQWLRDMEARDAAAGQS